MNTTIKTQKGESILTLTTDFGQILDTNFTAVFAAIANKIKILKELRHLFEDDDQVFNNLVAIVRTSFDEMEAVNKLDEELQISTMTAKYLLKLSLTDMTGLSLDSIEKELAKYKKQITAIYLNL